MSSPSVFFIPSTEEPSRRSLPLEIRTMIYKFAFMANIETTNKVPDGSAVLVRSTVEGRPVATNFSKGLSILQVSRQVYGEAEPLLWESLTLRFNDSKDLFLFCAQNKREGPFDPVPVSIASLDYLTHPFQHVRHVQFQRVVPENNALIARAFWALNDAANLKSCQPVDPITDNRLVLGAIRDCFNNIKEAKGMVAFLREAMPKFDLQDPTMWALGTWFWRGGDGLVVPEYDIDRMLSWLAVEPTVPFTMGGIDDVWYWD